MTNLVFTPVIAGSYESRLYILYITLQEITNG